MKSEHTLKGDFTYKYFIYLIVLLGGLSAFGPFVTDMYLPTLPAMEKTFSTTTSMVQLGLTTGLIGLALGQVFFGPVSDKYGRRPVLIFSMILFSVATLISVFAQSIEFFLICRLFQGLGGAGGIVLSRSIATDTYSGRDLAKIIAIIGAINGVAPIVAPVIGGLFAERIGWQGIFVILFILGVVLLIACLGFKESLKDENKFKGRILSTFAGYSYLVINARFVVNVIMYGLSMAILFSYISSAPFIIQEHYGYSELMFAIFFAVNSLATMIGSMLSLKFKVLENASLFGAVVLVLLSLSQVLNYLILDNFVVYEVVMFLILFSLGFIFTSATAVAMNSGREYVGAASAVVGAMGFLFGGIVSPIVGIGDVSMATSISLFVCSVIATTFAVIARRYSKTP